MLSVVIGVLSRIFSNSFSNVLQKSLANEVGRSSVINFYTYLGMSILGLIFCHSPLFNYEILKYILIMGALGALGNYYIIKALSVGELSVLAPVNSYKPVIGMIFGIAILGEIPSLLDILGVLLIICGTFILVYRRTISNKALWYRALALLFSGCEAIFIKKIILLSDVKSAFLYWALFGLFFAAILCIRHGLKFRRSCVPRLLLLVISTAIMQYSTNYVFSKIPVASALALFQLSILVSVFFGIRLFKEKGLIRKLVAASVMLIGAVILIL